jgi:hypothetical protein
LATQVWRELFEADQAAREREERPGTQLNPHSSSLTTGLAMSDSHAGITHEFDGGAT